MSEFGFARYFNEQVLRKRPYLKRQWCIDVILSPIRSDVQDNGRTRHWGRIPEAGDRIMRVVLLEDGYTILNAFFDRGFKDET